MTARPRGRPRGWRAANPRRTMINVRLTAAEVALLDDRVAAAGTDRSAVLRALLVTEEDDMKRKTTKDKTKAKSQTQAAVIIEGPHLTRLIALLDEELAARRAVEIRRNDTLEQLVRRAPEIVKDIVAPHQPKPDPDLDSLKRQVERRKLEVELVRTHAEEEQLERARTQGRQLGALKPLLDRWAKTLDESAGAVTADVTLARQMLKDFTTAVLLADPAASFAC